FEDDRTVIALGVAVPGIAAGTGKAISHVPLASAVVERQPASQSARASTLLPGAASPHNFNGLFCCTTMFDCRWLPNFKVWDKADNGTDSVSTIVANSIPVLFIKFIFQL